LCWQTVEQQFIPSLAIASAVVCHFKNAPMQTYNEMKKIGLSLIISLCYSATTIACSGFYIKRGDIILAGNNEDFINPKTKMWIVPGENGNYGKIFFGFDDYYPQGGINEKGLFFDGFGAEQKKVLKSLGKPKYEKVYDNFQNEILSTCANIDDVIAFLNKYNLDFLENGMFFFGDSKGESVIIEGDSFIRKKGDFQIVTNFRQSQTKNITCERYNTIYQMLNKSKNINVDKCKDILDAVHSEGETSTLYSQVYDIKNLIVYIYNFHDFTNCVKIDLKKELKKGLQYYDLPLLFPKSTDFQNFENNYFRDIKNEIAKRQLIKPDANGYKNFKGLYILTSSVGPDNKSYPVDSKHTISIDIKNDKIIYTELYGQYFRCILLPESNRDFFYKINYGELRISFPKEKVGDFYVEAVTNNNERYKWTCRKIK